MFDLLHELTDWLLAFADSDWAVAVLVAASFTESIFFPVPPDPLLIGIAVARPNDALWLAALVTIASVAGALVGHWIGLKLGRPLLYRWFPEDKVLGVESFFKRYGAWAILIAAFTPLPYKVFAITAGVLDLDRRTFILASLVGRGARFLALGGLVFVFGESIEAFIDNNFEALTVATIVAIAAVLLAAGLYYRRRRGKSASLLETGSQEPEALEP